MPDLLPDYRPHSFKRSMRKVMLGVDAFVDSGLFRSFSGLRESYERFSSFMDRFHVSRSFRRTLNADRFTVTHDRDFAAVIASCADREQTWINAELERAMLALHASGHAHSIEVWSDSV